MGKCQPISEEETVTTNQERGKERVVLVVHPGRVLVKDHGDSHLIVIQIYLVLLYSTVTLKGGKKMDRLSAFWILNIIHIGALILRLSLLTK